MVGHGMWTRWKGPASGAERGLASRPPLDRLGHMRPQPATHRRPARSSASADPIFFVGLDVHKDSATAAVSRKRDIEPRRVDRLPNDLKRIRRSFEHMAVEGEP